MTVLRISAFSLGHSRCIKDELLHYLQNKINLRNLKYFQIRKTDSIV